MNAPVFKATQATSNDDDLDVSGPIDGTQEAPEAVKPPETPAKNPFAKMKSVASENSSDDDYDDPSSEFDEPAPDSAPSNDIENSDEAEAVDDDDFEVADQLDHVDPAVEEEVEDEVEEEIIEDNLDDIASPAPDHDTTNEPEAPDEASPSADMDQMSPEMIQRMQAQQGRGPGGGAAAAAGGGALSSIFRSRGNSLGRPAKDNSLPKAMSPMEAMANKNPVKAANFYKTASDETIREKLYRDNFYGINEDMAKADDAKSRYVAGVKEFNKSVEKAASGTALAKMANDNGTSIGEFVNAVTSGTIKDVAAQSLVRDLEQDSSVKNAQDNLMKASGDFQESVKGVTKKASTLETNFPGRADMEMRASQLKQMAEEIGEQSPSKINEKMKKLQKEMDDFIKGILESVKNIVKAVASKVPGASGPK